MSNEAKLGTIPKGDEGKDAVHVAIVPIQVGSHGLTVGSPVKIEGGKAVSTPSAYHAVGILDPFLVREIGRDFELGQWVWLCLFPKTIKGLRHVWEHPAFPLTQPTSTPTSDKSVSEAWLKDYVRKHCLYWEDKPDGGYAEFLRYVEVERWIYYYGSDCHSLGDVDDADELFRHLSIVLGRRIDASYFEAFTCTC